MNKTQFDILQKDIDLVVEEYQEKKRSTPWILQHLMLVQAWEPLPATELMIERALKDIPDILNTHKLLTQSARQKDLMKLCEQIKNERR
jgi:diketogulonate reductase-like aldo/keto reductase